MKQEEEDEFDDVDIVNGKLIYKTEKKQEKEILPKVDKIVSKWEEVAKDKIDVEENINQKIIGLKKELSQLKDIETKPISLDSHSLLNSPVSDETDEISIDLRRKKGRTRDIEGFYVFLQSAGRGELTIKTYKYSLNWWEKVAERSNVNLYNLKIKHIEEASKILYY
jgi:hypothetical protein